jgi:hypothetical protein
MKKASKKLMLRNETVRDLVNIDLARAVGGAASRDNNQCGVAYDSGIAVCIAKAVISNGTC